MSASRPASLVRATSTSAPASSSPSRTTTVIVLGSGSWHGYIRTQLDPKVYNVLESDLTASEKPFAPYIVVYVHSSGHPDHDGRDIMGVYASSLILHLWQDEIKTRPVDFPGSNDRYMPFQDTTSKDPLFNVSMIGAHQVQLLECTLTGQAVILPADLGQALVSAYVRALQDRLEAIHMAECTNRAETLVLAEQKLTSATRVVEMCIGGSELTRPHVLSTWFARNSHIGELNGLTRVSNLSDCDVQVHCRTVKQLYDSEKPYTDNKIHITIYEFRKGDFGTVEDFETFKHDALAMGPSYGIVNTDNRQPDYNSSILRALDRVITSREAMSDAKLDGVDLQGVLQQLTAHASKLSITPASVNPRLLAAQ